MRAHRGQVPPIRSTVARLLLVATVAGAGIGSWVSSGHLMAYQATAKSVVADDFDREVADGWGRADPGGSYRLTAEPSPNYAVANGEGLLTLNPDRLALSAILEGAQAIASDHLFRVRIDQLPAGGGVNVYHLGRVGGSGAQYRARLTFLPDGRLRLGVDKLVPEAEAPIDLGSATTVRGLTYAANQEMWFRAQFDGVAPTTIRLKVWTDGELEPAGWLAGVSDDEPQLQRAGAVGVLVTAGRAVTSLPLTLAFDDYTVSTLNRGAATPTTELRPTVPTVAAAEHPVIMAAGDIACGADTPPADCVQGGTAELILRESPDAVLALGDIQYECGELEDFLAYLDPTWGQFKDLILPVIGNHEYQVSQDETGHCLGLPRGAPGYWTYFGDAATPLEPGCRVDCQGWYSFDIGSWHVVALNSNCSQVGGCGANSPQGQWLRADLAAHPSTCTLAYWHHPFVSSGNHGSFDQYREFWEILYQAGVDVVLVGHDHHFERFAPIDTEREFDPDYGIRQFIVGTGGKNLTGLSGETGRLPISEVYNDTTFGVLKLRLLPTRYEWVFVPVIEGDTPSFTDAGIGACHAAPDRSAETPQASAETWPALSSDVVFADDFERGTLNAWSSTTGLTIQQIEVANGGYAVRGTAAGTKAIARRKLDPPESGLIYQLHFKLISTDDNPVNLLRFGDTAGGSILGVFISAGGMLGVRNDVSRVTLLSDVAVELGEWHVLQVQIRVDGAASQISVWFDGVPVALPSGSINLGSLPIGRVDLGDSADGRTFDIAFDDVLVTRPVGSTTGSTSGGPAVATEVAVIDRPSQTVSAQEWRETSWETSGPIQ